MSSISKTDFAAKFNQVQMNSDGTAKLNQKNWINKVEAIVTEFIDKTCQKPALDPTTGENAPSTYAKDLIEQITQIMELQLTDFVSQSQSRNSNYSLTSKERATKSPRKSRTEVNEPTVGNRPASYQRVRKRSIRFQGEEIPFDGDIELLPEVLLRESSQDLKSEDLNHFIVPYIYPADLSINEEQPAYNFNELAKNSPGSTLDQLSQNSRNITEEARRSITERTNGATEFDKRTSFGGQLSMTSPNGFMNAGISTVQTSQLSSNMPQGYKQGGSMSRGAENLSQGYNRDGSMLRGTENLSRGAENMSRGAENMSQGAENKSQGTTNAFEGSANVPQEILYNSNERITSQQTGTRQNNMVDPNFASSGMIYSGADQGGMQLVYGRQCNRQTADQRAGNYSIGLCKIANNYNNESPLPARRPKLKRCQPPKLKVCKPKSVQNNDSCGLPKAKGKLSCPMTFVLQQIPCGQIEEPCRSKPRKPPPCKPPPQPVCKPLTLCQTPMQPVCKPLAKPFCKASTCLQRVRRTKTQKVIEQQQQQIQELEQRLGIMQQMCQKQQDQMASKGLLQTAEQQQQMQKPWLQQVDQYSGFNNQKMLQYGQFQNVIQSRTGNQDMQPKFGVSGNGEDQFVQLGTLEQQYRLQQGQQWQPQQTQQPQVEMMMQSDQNRNRMMQGQQYDTGTEVQQPQEKQFQMAQPGQTQFGQNIEKQWNSQLGQPESFNAMQFAPVQSQGISQQCNLSGAHQQCSPNKCNLKRINVKSEKPPCNPPKALALCRQEEPKTGCKVSNKSCVPIYKTMVPFNDQCPPPTPKGQRNRCNN